MTVYTPSFTAANSTTAIPNFTNRQNVMGINSNAAYPVTSAADSFATFNTPMSSDDVTLTVTVGSLAGAATDVVKIIFGVSLSGDVAFAQFAQSSMFLLGDTTGGWGAGAEILASGTGMAYTTGTVLTFSRVGNVYTCKNGATTVLSWTDSGNTYPRDGSHRLVGVGGYNSGGINYRRISAMTATDFGSKSNFFAMF